MHSQKVSAMAKGRQRQSAAKEQAPPMRKEAASIGPVDRGLKGSIGGYVTTYRYKYIYNRDTHTSVIVVLACVVPYKIYQGYTYIYIYYYLI